MVFIRPTIVGDPAAAQRVTAPRYDYMRDAQLQLHDSKQREAALDALVRDYLRTHPPVPPLAPAHAPAPSPAPATPLPAPAVAAPLSRDRKSVSAWKIAYVRVNIG